MSTGVRPVVNYWQKLVNVVKEQPLACFVMCCVLSQTFLQIAGVVTHACFAYLLCFYANISRSCKAFTLLCKFYMLLSVTQMKGAIFNINIFVCVRGKFLKCPFSVGCLKMNTRTIIKFLNSFIQFIKIIILSIK